MPRRPRSVRRSTPQVPPKPGAGVTPGITHDAVARSAGSSRSKRPLGRAAMAGAAVTAIALAAYVATAARDLVFGDSPELIAVAATLGVAHPPGYPLWTLIGHVFTWLPVGPIPFRVTLVSVVTGAACVGVVYAIALRLSRSVPASSVAALLLVFHPLFWQWSIVAEVFALNALLAAVVTYCSLRWAEQPRSGGWLVAAAFTGGLGLAHQQTIVLLGPAVLYLLWRRRHAFAEDRPLLAKAAGAFVAGLLPYLYLPIAASRDPAWSFGDLASIGDVVGHVLRSAYGSGQLFSAPELQGGPLADRLGALATSCTLLEAALVALGLVRMARTRRGADPLRFFALALLFTGPLFAAYANADLRIALSRAVVERFFVLPHVVAAPLAAVGVVVAAELVARGVPRRLAGPAVAAACLAVIAAGAIAGWTPIDRRDDRRARDFGADILVSAPQGALVIVAGDAAAFPAQYLHTIEGARPDLAIVQKTYLPADWYARQLQRHEPTLGPFSPTLESPSASFRAFLAANASRPTYVVGDILDRVAPDRFHGEPRGLLQLVVPGSQPADPDAAARETERLLALYHPADPRAIRGRAFEEIVLNDYGFAMLRVGRAFELAKRPAEARAWYERSLRLIPDFIDAKSALARLR